jgi:hypothetical protein
MPRPSKKPSEALRLEVIPATKSSIGANTLPASPNHGQWSEPSSSTRRPSGMCSARYLPLSGWTHWSFRRWSTRAGALMRRSIGRTSRVAPKSRIARAAAGGADKRIRRPNHSISASSSPAVGTDRRIPRPVNHACSMPALYFSKNWRLQPCVVGGSQHAGESAEENESGHAFGSRGGQGHGDRTRTAAAEQKCTLGADVVHDTQDVVDALLECHSCGRRIGHPHAPPIEDDQPPSVRQASQEI